MGTDQSPGSSGFYGTFKRFIQYYFIILHLLIKPGLTLHLFSQPIEMEANMALINNRYELIRIIGKGGFGTTWYARDTKLDMPVAVKELSDTDPSRKKKFLREARTLARFAREPGIVNVRDYLEYNGKAYMVMEYLDGSDLNTKIAEGGPISFDAAYHLLRPVILVLGKLHAEGVIHRDVSPDNIRMQSDGTIKLLDFGAAWNTTSTENATTTITVKPGYAPYEQYAGKERQGPFTDVYAVCATLYKCITGVTPPDALKRAFYDEIKTPSLLGARITPAEEAILMQGLAVNSSDRIQSMEELARLLDKAVGKSSPEMSGAFKSSMGSAGAAGRANGGRAFKSSVGKRSSEADSAHKDSPEKKNSEGNGKLQEQSTQGYAPHNYAVQDQTAHGYAAQSYAAQNYNAQGQPAQGYAAQNYNAQGQPAQSSSFVNSKQPGRDSAPDNIEKSDRKRRSESAYSGKPRRGIPKKPLIGLIMLVAAAIGIVFFIFSRGENNDSYRKTGSGEAVVLEKTPVTSERLQAIEKDANIKSLTLIRCELSDSMVEEISRITHLEKLRIDGCTGFTTLDPLADAPALNHLSITGQISNEYIEGSVNLDGSKLFTRDLPNVLPLSVTGSRIDGGTDCLGHFPNLETISLSLLEPYSIACIDKMPKLKEIELYDFDPSENDYLNLSGEEAKHLYGHPQLEILIAEDSNLSDLGWAAECTKLRDLFLSNCLISDLSPLADLTDLKWLHLSNNKVESVLPLSGCEKLEEIRLSGNPLTSLSGLEGLKNLEELSISRTLVSDLTPLAGCQKLRSLKCRNAQISDLSGLENCPLTYLCADGNQIADLIPLSANNTMVNLVVSDNLLTSLTGCEQMIYLKKVIAARNALTGIEGIMNCSGIETLDVSNNQISELSPLQNSFTSLKNLNISDNLISEIEPLSVCTSLENLNADNNEIKSLSPLEGCSKLTNIMAGNNALTDLSGLTGKPELNAVMVDHNQIQSLAPLKGSIKELHYLDIGCNNITDINPISELSVKEVVILAERNSISDLSPLPEGLRYRGLVFYTNPISDFSKLVNLRDVKINDKLYISWNENADMSLLGKTGFTKEMHIVSPPERRAAIGVAIKDAYEPSPGSLPVTPIFLSEEEADLEVASWRAELRDLVNSEMEAEENDPDDGSSVESTSGESSAESGTSSSDESSSQGSDIAS